MNEYVRFYLAVKPLAEFSSFYIIVLRKAMYLNVMDLKSNLVNENKFLSELDTVYETNTFSTICYPS